MTLVPRCTHDVFVSYAHVDDEPAPGLSVGWVTKLVEYLDWRVTQLCGRAGDFSLWMDPELAHHVDFTDQIITSVRETAVLLIVLSPGYVASDWCARERRTFLDLVREQVDRDSTVFVVERDKVELDERPEEISKLLGYRFWEDAKGHGPRILGHPLPDPNGDKDYYDRSEQLARDLHTTLQQLKARAAGVEAPLPKTPDAPVIYLAEVTDDLDALRGEVARYLDQSGFRVVPDMWYSRDVTEFQRVASKDLQESVLFSQLLSAVPGRKLSGASSSFVELQHRLARDTDKPILQWRSRDLVVEQVSDADHRALLAGTTVQAVELEDFKRTIVECAHRALAARQEKDPPTATEPGRYQPFVFVNVDRGDIPATVDLCQWLEKHGIVYALPTHGEKAEAIRKDIEANLVDCDGLIVVYGDIPPTWVREQLRHYRKMLYRRKTPLRALAVYEGPPETKEAIGMGMPSMRIVDCRNGLNEQDLQDFIESLSG